MAFEITVHAVTVGKLFEAAGIRVRFPAGAIGFTGHGWDFSVGRPSELLRFPTEFLNIKSELERTALRALTQAIKERSAFAEFLSWEHFWTNISKHKVPPWLLVDVSRQTIKESKQKVSREVRRKPRVGVVEGRA